MMVQLEMIKPVKNVILENFQRITYVNHGHHVRLDKDVLTGLQPKTLHANLALMENSNQMTIPTLQSVKHGLIVLPDMG